MCVMHCNIYCKIQLSFLYKSQHEPKDIYFPFTCALKTRKTTYFKAQKKPYILLEDRELSIQSRKSDRKTIGIKEYLENNKKT